MFQAPGGWSRFFGLIFLFASALLIVVTILVFADDSALQSDREFFPFITVFFIFLSLLGFFFWFVFWIIAKISGKATPPVA